MLTLLEFLLLMAFALFFFTLGWVCAWQVRIKRVRVTNKDV